MKRRENLRPHAFLFLAATIVFGFVIFVASHRHVQHPIPPPEPQATASAAIRIQSVAPKPPTIINSDRTIVSASIASVCGLSPTTSDRYEARNDALRSIARERHLPTNEVADDALRRHIRALFVTAAGRVKQPYAVTDFVCLGANKGYSNE